MTNTINFVFSDKVFLRIGIYKILVLQITNEEFYLVLSQIYFRDNIHWICISNSNESPLSIQLDHFF